MRTSDLTAAVATRNNLRDRLLTDYPTLADDVETLCDTLAGVDDLEEQIFAVLRAAVERDAYGKALSGLIDDMAARKRRLDEGAATLRLVALAAMQDAGLPKLRAPDMSVSIGRGKPKVQIIDEAALPDEFCRIKREANKAEIAKALAAGADVPGATLGNPQPFLSIHRS